ncbi:ABC transporter permease subunit [Tsukamurella sp. 8F]|uniref:ABC transporter permease n=1 Tax=unclassified Tsukamurella TaxID=2633480 RepID=UPI0023B9E6F7|nr:MULTISPECIES: ABC transporter permease subunit [unclassified Tsukamurella]MDF0529486.1 ABC transporter permease subunit [Tsukamurella sp. 8J]MDF0585826.1 ABC transporter permease subunit [Tsukamurella sp. 8F]
MRAWWGAVGIVVGLELRQRTRATRWKVMLAVVFAVVSLVVFGTMWFAMSQSHIGSDAYDDWAINLYFIVLGFVGFLGLVIAPTMTATAINGDRKDATLALVQATPISAAQLAVGKLLGAWAASTALLAVSLPYLVWAVVEAPYPVLDSILGIVVVALLFGCCCGIGLGYSALTARPVGSSALTYLTMLFLLGGLPIVVALLTPATRDQVTAIRPTWTARSNDSAGCVERARQVTVEHTERIAWLMAPNPAVVLADAAAHRDPGVAMWARSVSYTPHDDRPASPTGLGELAREYSRLRTGPNPDQNARCVVVDGQTSWSSSTAYDDAYDGKGLHLGDTWYRGLIVDLLIGGIGVGFAIRRLRVPAARLPRGVRIA